MTINQRIKSLRKDMKLNQKEFGAKIGLGQGAISWMEKEGNTITRQNVKIICDAFNVNEHWLRTGEGDMFKPVDEPNILDRLQRELNLNNAEMEIIKTFIELSPEQRRMGIQFIKDFSSKLNTNFAGVLDIPRVSEATTVSHSDTSARPAGISDDEWQLLQAARREKAQMSGTSGSISSEENRA